MKTHSNTYFTLVWTCDGSEPFSAELVEKSISLKACYDGYDLPQLSQYCGTSDSNRYEFGFLGNPAALLNWEINPTSWLHLFSGNGIALCIHNGSIVLNRIEPGFQLLYYCHFTRSCQKPIPTMQHFINQVIDWLDYIEAYIEKEKRLGIFFFWQFRHR